MRSFVSLCPFACMVLALACFAPSKSLAQNTPSRADTLTPASYYQHLQRAHALYEKALESYAASGFEAAIAPLEKALAYNPNDGTNWIRLGDSRYYASDYRGAAHAYKKARVLGYSFLGSYRFMNYSVAASYAQLGEKEEALHWLERSLYEGRLPYRQQLAGDDSFTALHDDERFQDLIGRAPAQPFDSRVEGWRSDVNCLLEEIKRLNAEYSERPLPDSIQQAANRLREKIPSLPDGEVWVHVQQLLAMLGQSHNSVWHFAGAERSEITQLPLTFYLFEDGLYIIDAERENLIGARIRQIGNASAEEAIEAVRSVVTSETPMKVKWLGPVYLRMPQVLSALGLTESAGAARLLLQMPGGSSRTVTLDAGPVERRRKLFASKRPGAGPAPLYLSRPDEPYWVEQIPEENLLYVQFNQIRSAEDESLPDFALRLRRLLKERDSVKNLLVDLRRNNGGNTFLYGELLRTLIWFDVQSERQLFVAIGRNTYSAAQNFVTDLDRLTEAVFLGEPSGGSPNTHGDESQVVLPYSGLRIGLSSVFWQQSHPRDERLWIAPDVPVGLTSKSYFTNEDPLMNAVQALIQAASLPSGPTQN